MYAMQTEVFGQFVSWEQRRPALICSVSVLTLMIPSCPCSYRLLYLNSKALQVQGFSFLFPETASTLYILCTARSKPNFAPIEAV